MPTYEYACNSCAEHLEVVQSFRDEALSTCPACGGPLRKVFGSIGVVFKGSGFYKTDNRSGSKAASKSSETKSSESSSETKSSESKSGSSGGASSESKSSSSGGASSGSKASAAG